MPNPPLGFGAVLVLPLAVLPEESASRSSVRRVLPLWSLRRESRVGWDAVYGRLTRKH